MSVNVRVDDGGTIEATLRKIKQLKREGPAVFDKVVHKFMRTVYNDTLAQMQSMNIRDTGALIASTRLERSGKVKGFDISKKETYSDWQVISGGGGVMNFKNRREVDYAKAVHDGYATTRGGWVVGRPYLDIAWARSEPKWKKFFSEYLAWIQKEWGKDQPPASLAQWKAAIGG